MAVGSFTCKGETLVIKETSLKTYAEANPMLEKRTIFGDLAGKIDIFVKDIAKTHAQVLIHSMSEFHRLGLCIQYLDHTNVVIAGDGNARFTNITLVAATPDLQEENYQWLEQILRVTLFQGQKLPYDMNHLLGIMRNEPLTSVYLMKYHVALVWQVNKTAFYMRMYDHINALRLRNWQLFVHILMLLPYRCKWRGIMAQNVQLNALSQGRYGASNDPSVFVRCYRNTSYHKMEDCCDPVTGDTLYTQEMFEDILDSEFPEYQTEMQYNLHKIGELEMTQVDSLFTA